MKTKKVKRPPTKAVLLKRVKKALSALWSWCVRMRDGYKCLMCGKTKGLSAHHWLFAKGHCQPLAYNVDNGATLCYACHIRKLHKNGDGDFILRLYEIMKKIVGEDSIARMREIAKERPELSLETMESMRGTLHKILDSGNATAFIAKEFSEHDHQSASSVPGSQTNVGEGGS